MIYLSEITKKLGQRIKFIRNKYGISQEELAFKASISTTYMGQLERGEKSPTVDTVFKLAKALDTSISELLLFDKEMTINNKNTILNKINAQLSTLSEDEQTELLKLIKNIKTFKSI